MTRITAIENKSVRIPIAPLENTSPKASTSLVKRVIIFPTGVRSKKRDAKEVTWTNKSLRISAVIRWADFLN
jgi:hypothetical protein